MKKLKTLFAAVVVVLLTACGATKTETAATQNTNRGRANTQISANQNTARGETGINRTARTGTATTARTAASTKADETARLRDMYSKINMTDQQIAKFERQWKAQSAAWKNENPNQTMNSFEQTEYQDRILRDILNDQQFAEYQQWARDHAAEGQ